MNELTFKILNVVVSLASIVITIYLIPFLKVKLQNQQNQQVRDFVSVAVKAAEQVLGGGGNGSIKKEQVTESVARWLNDKNIKITEDQLSQLIESAVYAMNNAGTSN